MDSGQAQSTTISYLIDGTCMKLPCLIKLEQIIYVKAGTPLLAKITMETDRNSTGRICLCHRY